jgi:hypothetical protein
MISHALFVICRCRNGQTYHENKSSQLQHIFDGVHHTQTSGAGGHSSFSKLFVKLQSPLQDCVAYSIILQLCRSVVYTLKWDIEAEILAAWPNFSSPQSIAVEFKLAGIEWVLQLDLQEFNCSVWGSTATLFWICRDFLKNPRSDTAIQPSLKTIYHQKTCIFYLANLWSRSLKCYVDQYPFQLGLSAGAHVTIQDLHVGIGFIFLSSWRVLKPLGCTQLGTNHSQAL